MLTAAASNVVDRPRARGATWAMWLATALVLGAAGWFVVRSCGYEIWPLAAYGLYCLFFVLVPGVVVLHAVEGRPISFTVAIALGLPTGFAIEIATFLAASAAGLKAWLPIAPVAWLIVLFVLWRRRSVFPVQWRLRAADAGVALGLSLAFLATVLAAVSQMFAESPLVGGFPQRPIFHDWVYLVSRAAAIKQHWPLEDPSLAGTSLQYHYFMMVHAAAASWVTKIEVTVVLLRLVVILLGAALVTQMFVLGRMLSRRAWGGVLAAWLTVATTEFSFSGGYQQPQFLGLFVRWLYVSPTFFFGVVFFAGLIIAIARCLVEPRIGVRHVVWLAALAAAGTGAKGTILPVLLIALAFLFAWACGYQRRIVWRFVVLGGTMGLAFVGVYSVAMAKWGTGEATVEPFHVFHVTAFWQHYVIPWQRALKHWLHAPDFGTWLGASLCGAAVLAGTFGVKVLAIPYALRPPRDRRWLIGWLAATLLASCALGMTLHLDSNSELYFMLLARIPTAVLAAACFVAIAEQLQAAFRSPSVNAPAGAADNRISPALVWRRIGLATLVLAIAASLGVQTVGSFARQKEGLAAWFRFTTAVKTNDDLLPMYEAMRWVRGHTEPNAVLLANAFTANNLRHERGVIVDHTTAGVHYYYSALGERRLWIEGPTYQLDTHRAFMRLVDAAEFFYHGRAPATLAMSDPCYVVVDHSIGDGATVPLAATQRVFSNSRFEIYKLPRNLDGDGAGGQVATLR